MNPDRDIDEGAAKVHGLTLDFLQDKPRFIDIVDEFLEFIKDSELLIHNAEFDVGFLNNELKLIPGKSAVIDQITEKIIDTLQIAREKHPGQRNSLDALVQRYEVGGYDREYHGALLDSKILGDVYLAMTGGQSNLLFEHKSKSSDTSEREKKKKVTNVKNNNSLLTKLSESEEKQNLEYLKKMQEETGTKPIWLKNQ